jgi:hypothetical protein
MRLAQWVSLACFLIAVSILSADDPADFARARPALERRLRDKSAAARIAALDDLRRFPLVDAARLALPLTRDAEASVRAAAVGALAQQQADAKVRSWMFESLRKDLAEWNGIFPAVLLSAEDEPRDVLDLLDKTLKARPAKLAIMLPGIAEVGGWHDSAAVRSLRRFTQLACFPKSLSLERWVALAAIGICHNDAVPLLIDLTAKLEGEVQFEVGSHLNLITGQRHGVDAKAWQEWWRTNAATFRYPTPDALAQARKKAEEGGPSYYGIPLRARRLVFVIDTSGSMRGERLAAAQKELVQAIDNLTAEAQFNILVFDSKLAIWSQKLVTATPDNKKRAASFVNNLIASGNTCTYDALRAALEMKVESVYVLTDGAPTNGQIVRLDLILAAVQAQNRLVGSSINVIGIAPGPDNGIFSLFLKALAADNHGQYRKVE